MNFDECPLVPMDLNILNIHFDLDSYRPRALLDVRPAFPSSWRASAACFGHRSRLSTRALPRQKQSAE